jgi:molybdopterin biosynthesis enzyme
MPTVTDIDHPQRITRLTPLADVLALIDARVKPVAPHERVIDTADNCVLAEDVVVEKALPTAVRALRDGYAVDAEISSDASSYAPVPLATPPVRVDLGDVVPNTTAAVAPLDAVIERDGHWEAMAPVASGEGLLLYSADMAPGTLLRSAGQWLRPLEMVALTASGRQSLTVRIPRVTVLRWQTGKQSILDAALRLLAKGIEASGGQPRTEDVPASDAKFWERRLSEHDADFLVVIGGTGIGRHDASVRKLADKGEVAVHGIAISPGETAAIGFIGGQPVLLVPGRVDAAFAVWRLLGWRILARLAGRTEDPPTVTARLTRKVASSLGLAELVLVRVRNGEAAPIASGYLPLSALVEADGWILIPPESEGYPPGAEVVIRPCL